MNIKEYQNLINENLEKKLLLKLFHFF